MARTVFITGGTGYIGKDFIFELVKRGHNVHALVRKGSEHKLPTSCTPIIGSALDKSTFEKEISPADTFVQLVGVSHANPSKAYEFRSIDLVSAGASIEAAKEAGINHFIYVSVAHPAPIMQAYIDVRKECERLIKESGIDATVLRPWYVVGEGHWWPLAILPVYWVMELFPSTRDSARRLGLVTLKQMVHALAYSVENPATGFRVIDVPAIKQLSKR